MLPNYNVALTFEEEYSVALTKFAQDVFLSKADGYCLGDCSIPHITLAQAYFDSTHNFDHIVNGLSLLEVGENSVYPEDSRYREGSGIHMDKLWYEIVIQKTPFLIDLQQSVFSILKKNGGNILTKGGADYSPHITFARLGVLHSLNDISVPQEYLSVISKPKLSFGLSDANGQFLEILWPQ